ncbi:melatonin receptor type 1B-A-like [Branchiostoma floridae x Branchiostoma belcheri]
MLYGPDNTTTAAHCATPPDPVITDASVYTADEFPTNSVFTDLMTTDVISGSAGDAGSLSVIQWTFIVQMGVISVVGTLGNILVILSFCRFQQVRSSMNLFVLNIAVSDLLITAVQAPTRLAAVVTGHPPGGGGFCAFLGFIGFLNCCISVLSSALIAFNRYIRISKSANTYIKLFGPLKSCLWIAGSWGVCALIIILPGMLGVGRFGWDEVRSQCDLDSNHPYSRYYFSLVFGGGYWISVSIVVVFYVKTYLFVKNSVVTIARSRTLGNKREYVSTEMVRRTRHMFIIFCTSTVLQAPAVLLESIDFTASFIPFEVIFVGIFLFGSCHAINPFMYPWKVRVFRRAFKALLQCKRDLPFVPGQSSSHAT